MRSVEGPKKACVACGVLTSFQRDVRGKRGALLRWEPCCVDCGEHNRPAKTDAKAAA